MFLPKQRAIDPITDDMALSPYQIIAPRVDELTVPSPTLCRAFKDLLPRKPYAADDLREGLRILPRHLALSRRHIQFNTPSALRWMLHDIDRADAYFAHDDANVPEPNVIVINPSNGHAHAAYLLAVPVARHSAARVSPLRFFAAVERGIGHRIGADPRYTGLIAKNPLHSDWRAYWRRELPYPLEELADCLFQRDLAIDLLRATTFGAGRNCSLFDALRAIAYRDWRECHYSGDGEAFRRHLERVALNINAEFPVPLRGSEVRALARSVARWVARHFTAQRFLHRQSTLGIRGNKKRWAGHIAAESTKPWQAAGISRRTWYRRKRARQGPQSSQIATSL